MQFFEGHIIKEYMSAGKGLKSRSGQSGIRGSWHVRNIGVPENIIVTLGSDKFYAEVHQTGKTIRAKVKFAGKPAYLTFKIGDKWIRKKEVTIPKRLYVLEDFRKLAPSIIRQKVSENLKKALT